MKAGSTRAPRHRRRDGGAGQSVSGAFLPLWNRQLLVLQARPVDAHRPPSEERALEASFSLVDTRQVASDYTVRFASKIYQIAHPGCEGRIAGANVRVESRLDDSIAVRFRDHYLSIAECPPKKPAAPVLKHPS